MWPGFIQDLSVAAAALFAGLAWWQSRGDSGRKKQQNQVQAAIDISLHPVVKDVTLLKQQFESLSRSVGDAVEAAVTRAIAPLQRQLAVLETKVEPMWDNWRQLAIDVAKILHQPDPRRAHIDALLESLMADTLSAGEEAELRDYLVKIRNWEPGQDVGFPVHQGEQTAAAILLTAMSHVITRPGSDRNDR